MPTSTRSRKSPAPDFRGAGRAEPAAGPVRRRRLGPSPGRPGHGDAPHGCRWRAPRAGGGREAGDWYQVAITHRSLHHALDTFGLDLAAPEPLFARRRPAPPADGVPPLERFTRLFGRTALAVEVFAVLEDLRVDAAALRRSAGWRRRTGGCGTRRWRTGRSWRSCRRGRPWRRRWSGPASAPRRCWRRRRCTVHCRRWSRSRAGCWTRGPRSSPAPRRRSGSTRCSAALPNVGADPDRPAGHVRHPRRRRGRSAADRGHRGGAAGGRRGARRPAGAGPLPRRPRPPLRRPGRVRDAAAGGDPADDHRRRPPSRRTPTPTASPRSRWQAERGRRGRDRDRAAARAAAARPRARPRGPPRARARAAAPARAVRVRLSRVGRPRRPLPARLVPGAGTHAEAGPGPTAGTGGARPGTGTCCRGWSRSWSGWQPAGRRRCRASRTGTTSTWTPAWTR